MQRLRFTKSHEWVKIQDNLALIGISDYAQSQLGDIVFVELPSPGNAVKQKGVLGTIESTKAASEVYAPISGEVVEVNSELVNSPQWINEEPYDKGWLVRLKPTNLSELDALMEEESYKEFVAQEAH